MIDKVAHARFMAAGWRKLARKRSAAAVLARLQEGMSDLQVERMRMERDEARARAVQVAVECASEHTDDDGVDLVVHYRERDEQAEAEVERLRGVLGDAYAWVTKHPTGSFDGACAQCMGEDTGCDFVCVPHRAEADRA